MPPTSDTAPSTTFFGLSSKGVLRLELCLLAGIMAFFLGTAWVHLGTVPAPWQDEPWLMQPGFELATEGHLGLPMFRIRGNHLESKVFDAPVFFLETAAWFRLFGFSLYSARAYNLVVAALALLLVYAFARRTQGALGALLAVALIATEGNFFDIARTFRNDCAVLMHAWIAFNLYVWAERHHRSQVLHPSSFILDPSEWRFILVGMAAGAAVQTHLNGLYVLGIVGLWLLMEHKLSVWRAPAAWSLALGVILSFVPFALYCATDWPAFVGQWKGTPGRYAALQGGLLDNVQHEWKRYFGWGINILNWGGGQSRLWATWGMMSLGIVFALVRLAIKARERWAVSGGQKAEDGEKTDFLRQAWVRTFAATMFIVIFFMVLDEPKSPNYIPHLSVWFALLVGELACEVFSRPSVSPPWKPAAVLGVVLALYGGWTVLVFARYLRWTQHSTPAPYGELAGVLREAVPTDLVPVGYPTHWLAFTDNPNYLACKSRFWRKLPGKDYVFIVDQKGIASNSRKFPRWLKENSPQFSVLAEIQNTLYGNITVYYTGTNPRWQNRPILRYRFFGQTAGFERLPPIEAKKENDEQVNKPGAQNPSDSDDEDESGND